MEVLTAKDIEMLKNLQTRMYELLSDAWVEFEAEVNKFADCNLVHCPNHWVSNVYDPRF